MQSLNSEILKSLQNNIKVVQVTIIEQNGSTPRTAGTKMLVFEDGTIKGTIGGGLYEAKAIEFAKNLFTTDLNEQDMAHFLSFDMQTKAHPTDMDMICGGALRVMLECIYPADINKELYLKLNALEEENKSAFLITKIIYENKIERARANINKALVSADKESLLLNTEILPKELYALLEENKEISNYFEENTEYCIDTIKRAYTLYIFGAGHVSLELAKIANYLEFKTIVIDDRAEFCNKERFKESRLILLPSLDKDEVSKFICNQNIGDKEGIIIVTRGHARDKEVLECALKTKTGYLGMIGSKSKRKATYENLIASGYNKKDFERIYSPIGLSIGAQSPEEIAISICAQLIQFRAGKLNCE